MKIRIIQVLGLILAPVLYAQAETYLTLQQAQQVLWQETPIQAVPITLSEAQVDAIEEASDIRVLTDKIRAWKTDSGGWFLVDQVIGKHEMIDVAVAIAADGTIKDLRVMQYNESYGSEVKHPGWLAQFKGRDNSAHLKLDIHIDNISGATLSCRHITDGVNRWTHTWDIALRHL